MDAKKLVSHLLDELEHVTSTEERDAYDPSWLRGYVAGVTAAAQYALECDHED